MEGPRSPSLGGWSSNGTPHFRDWEGSVAKGGILKRAERDESVAGVGVVGPKKSVQIGHANNVDYATTHSGKSEAGGDNESSNSDLAVPTNTDEESIDSDASLEAVVPEWGQWRNRCREVVLYNSWFERFWLFVIVLNCITLSIEDPTDEDCVTSVCQFTEVTGDIFTFLFVIECVVKIAGLGFRKRRGAYLKDEWNVLDFLIVVSGLASFFAKFFIASGNSAALTGLRAFRLLRPLKAVQAFPAVRVLVQSILASLPQLLDVFVLYFFFVLTMGIIAVQQWKGVLGWRCVTWDDPNVWDEEDRVCKDGGPWEYGGHLCPWGHNCTDIRHNPADGKLSFDHIGVTGLTLFTGLTLEGWTDTMYHTMDATTYFASVYWVLLVIFGSFFVLNLTIVIITEAFEKKQQEQKTAAFFAIDKDGTGELDRDEVRALLQKRYNREITEEELDDAFDAMDEDGGGTISLSEFLAYTQHQSNLINKKSSMSGLGDDLRKLAKMVPGYPAAHASYIRGKAVFDKATSPRDKPTQAQQTCYDIVTEENDSTTPGPNSVFKKLILLVIFLNTVALAVEYYGQPRVMTDILYFSNVGFTVVFTIEAVMKLFGLGVAIYFDDSFNTFDLVVVVLSWVDILFIRGGANVSIFRTFRVLRVLKLAKAFPTLQRWIRIVVSSIKGAAILTALLGLVVFIIALIGMQLFGGKFCFLDEDWDPSAHWVEPHMLLKGKNCGGKPRSHYDDLGTAILTTFQILTGEDWNIVMYNGMKAVGDWSCVYFVLYYIIGNYLMLNLFIAVLLNNRELKESGEEGDMNDSNLELTKPDPILDDGDGGSRRRTPIFLRKYVDSNRSLFLLSEQNSFRYWMYRTVESWPFESIVFVCILASTIFLALENPRFPPDHPMSQTLNDANFIMIWVFVLEASMKAIGYGFLLHENSYLRRESWNRLDFFIVVVSLAALVLPGGGAFDFIKIMRTLRPLRLINKSPGMKVVVQALFTSVGPLINVLLISFLVWLIFGIMGVQVFKGAFYRCSDVTFGDVEAAFPNITSEKLCLNNCPVERCRWMNYSSHFNNLPVALVTLFEMASLEGWVDVMRLGMDHVEPGMSPREGYNKFWAAYFLAFIVFGSFFIINMFIGVLIDTYYQEKEKAAKGGGQMFLNDRQKQWVTQHKKMMASMKTVADPADVLLFPQMSFVLAKPFDLFISVCIVLNVIIMAMEYYGSPPAYDTALESTNLMFIVIFGMEAALKLIAMGPCSYFTFAWNRFDFSIVMLSVLGEIMTKLIKVDSVVSVFRILRLARLLRMVRRAKGIQRILNTLLLSIFSLVNVAGILFLLLFVYATLGVKLFATVKRGESMGHYANFENFINAMLLLLRMSTGEAWQAISSDLRVEEPDCDPQLGECGHPYISYVYFCSYTMAGMYVLLNLFIAVILDNFSESADMEEGETVTQEYIDLMHAAWDARAIDANGMNVLTAATLQDYLKEIGPPLGPSPHATLRKVQYFIVALDAHHDENGHLHKEEIFLKLFKKAYGEQLPPEVEQEMDEQFMKTLDLNGGDAKRSVVGNKDAASLSQQVAGVRVQALIKSWLARRRVTQLKAELRHPLLPPSAGYTSSVVPEEIKQVTVSLPNGEKWTANPSFRTAHPPSRPSRRDLDPVLRMYYENWNTLTPEQRRFYFENHERVFEHDPHTSSAYVALQGREASGDDYTL